MVEVASGTDGAPEPRKGKGGLIVALAGAMIAGGGGFAATYLGVFDGLLAGGGHAVESPGKSYRFVPLDTLVVTLGPQARSQALRMTAQLEVAPEAEEAVTEMVPRILDVLNGYLRAVDEDELEDPASLALLRAQMLRRIQVVVGDGLVRDLLILEFILN